MKNGGERERGDLIERWGLINIPPLKRGGLLERGGGGLNRGFTVLTPSNICILNLL